MTIFAKIISKEIPADIVYEDELALAFRDIAPQAPVHVLVIPREPLPGISAATPEHTALLGHLMQVVQTVARQEGIEASGYRVVANNGDDAQQTVPHLHFHVLGGRKLGWPPG